MTRHRITIHQLRRILTSFGVVEYPNRGKGSHTIFAREVNGHRLSYPIPTSNKDVHPAYVKGVRRALRIEVPDDEFFGRVR